MKTLTIEAEFVHVTEDTGLDADGRPTSRSTSMRLEQYDKHCRDPEFVAVVDPAKHAEILEICEAAKPAPAEAANAAPAALAKGAKGAS